MEQKDKKLLLKDLSARLPHKVKCNVYKRIGTLVGLNDYGAEIDYGNGEDTTCEIQYCLPYLRAMSSMTEEEKEEFAEVTGGNCSFIDAHGNFFIDFGEFICEGSPVSLSRIVYVINWLYAHHFDVNNLIPKGLALKAPKDMYVTNQ